MKQLRERVAVITGAGSGIGRALATQLAREGCHLALVDIDGVRLDEVKAELASSDRNVTTYSVDVADRDAMRTLPDRVVADHGAVHIVINNAGVAVAGELETQSFEDLDWIIGINFWGVLHGCKFFTPVLKRQDEGHIVNISSLFGLIGLPTQGAYCASKAAVRSLSETLSAELSNTPVRVTSVHPGGVRTNIVRDGRFEDPKEREEMVASFERLGVEPEHAAARIVEAIRREKLRLLICKETYFTDWLRRLLPVSTSRLVNTLARRGKVREAKAG